MKLTQRLSSLENRMVIPTNETWRQMLKSDLAWPALGWLLETSIETYAVAVVLAVAGEDDRVKQIFCDIAPACIAGSGRRMPTQAELSWAVAYIRASYVWICREPWFIAEIARWELEEGLDNEQNTD